MCLIRVSFARRFKAAGIQGVLVSTVHDSIIVDVLDSEVNRVSQMFFDVFEAVPSNMKRVFDVDFNLPCRCEVVYGKTLFDKTEWTPTKMYDII